MTPSRGPGQRMPVAGLGALPGCPSSIVSCCRRLPLAGLTCTVVCTVALSVQWRGTYCLGFCEDGQFFRKALAEYLEYEASCR